MSLTTKRKIGNKMMQVCQSCLHGIYRHDKEKGCLDCKCSNRFPYSENYKQYVRENLHLFGITNAEKCE